MARNMKDIAGRALQRRTRDAMGRALFHGSPHKGEKKHKKQGYKAREDESLGMRTGREAGKKQSMKARRDESYGDWGKRGNQKINKAKGGTVKKQHGGMAPPVGGAAPAAGGAHQGYNARLDESLGARNPGATGSMAGRRAMSEGMERSMGRGPYSGAATMAKRGGTIKKKKKK
jgi:hypothetical protein